MNHPAWASFAWDTSGKDLRRVRVGEAKCPTCDGLGRVCSIVGEHFWGRRWKRCERCDGKGYLEGEVVGETISYGGGKVPEPRLDVASLVREARQKYHDTLPSYGYREVLNWYGYLELCDALEEKEREIEDLGRDLIDCESQLTDALRHGETAEANVVGLEREVEQLRGISKELAKRCEELHEEVWAARRSQGI